MAIEVKAEMSMHHPARNNRSCPYRARPPSGGDPEVNRPLRYWLRRACQLCGLCALIATTSISAQPVGPSAAKLIVGGNVATPLTLNVDDLKRLPVQHLEDVRQVRVGGATVRDGEQVRRCTGVLLRDVLTAAKPAENERHELRQSIVVVTATDGYITVFSWAELFLSPIGDGALVIYARDGAPLAANEGPLALVSLRDTQPGPRHVKWLQKVELRRIRD